MTVTKASSYLFVLATILTLAACATGSGGNQQQSGTNNPPKPAQPTSGGY